MAMTAAERRELLRAGRGARREWTGVGFIHECFDAQVERTPDAEAVRFEGSCLSYGQLSDRANRLAHFLRRAGVGRGVLVGVCFERSLDLVVALLAVLKAGAAVLPIDQDYPLDRVAFMLEDARAQVLLTQRRMLSTIPATDAAVVCVDELAATLRDEPNTSPDVEVGPDDPAYVIYTSGSMGRPKGVVNVHRGIRNRLLWMQDAFGLDQSDRVLQKTPISFDVSVWEFFWPLMSGARLLICRPGGHRDGRYLVDLIRREGVTTVHFVPSMLQLFLMEDGVEDCADLRRVICSGEVIPYELQERFFARSTAELHNLYGPTEAAIDVTWWACRRDGDRRPVPIGHPIANVQVYVLDSDCEPVRTGETGELFISGDCLARGYLNRPELTAERFSPHPFDPSPGRRMYHTGDLARFRQDGAIEFVGRLDDQIKLRGIRIEPGEIESALAGHPRVLAALVVPSQYAGDTRLVAYVSGDSLPPVADLIKHLRCSLPDYMIPAAVVVLPAFPLTPSGKVDRSALPAPNRSRPELETPYEAPRGWGEQTIADVWAQVLGIDRVGVNDDFRALGGHSLLLAELRDLMRARLDQPVALVDLFESPTVRVLAGRLAADTWS